MRYHLHIYRILAMAEIDLEANDGEEARTMALRMTDHDHDEVKFGQPDCDRIVIDFLEEAA